MYKINQYPFPLPEDALKKDKYAKNWPIVYLLDDNKYIYVGETYNLISRMRQHKENPEKRIFKRVHVVYDNEFNKSATLDIESALIRYMSADEKFIVSNKNEGLVNSNYYQRDLYQKKIVDIWSELQKINLAKKNIIEIENSDLFKFSPYKALSEDQLTVAVTIHEDLFHKTQMNEKGVYFINGLPGSGKTVLATYLMKYLQQSEDLKFKKIALVISMSSLRNTIKKTFRNVEGLKSSMVIGPSDIHKDEYDLLIVDEAHRLRQRTGIVNYASFDQKNLEFELENGNELDWIKQSAKHLILFYDENQSIRPSDISKTEFNSLNPTTSFTLQSQFRVMAGMEYVHYVKNIFNNEQLDKRVFENYECGIFESFSDMYTKIKAIQATNDLSLLVSGYSYEWVSKQNPSLFDFNIDGIKLQWNSTSDNFIYSKNAPNEVGCIHTVQGYELNYVGLIIGEDIDYDFKHKEIIINPSKYYDRNGKVSTTYDQLKQYIQNIYMTLATRGIKGIYFYVVNPNMKKYLSQFFDMIHQP